MASTTHGSFYNQQPNPFIANEEINQAQVDFEDWCRRKNSRDLELFVREFNLSPDVVQGLRERFVLEQRLFAEAQDKNSAELLSKFDLYGTEIGDFRLIRQLGQGGMGTVWLAEQQKRLKRKVAIKLIKPGFDSEEFVRRFALERHTLALMSHPGIANVLDAGLTNDGRPYLVMEYIQGTSIVKYCEQNQLSIEQRLQLFLQLCRAVQHAHQKGIVHRDIKPSNVLVTDSDGTPIVKVIDFGLAKACESENPNGFSSITRQPMMLGSPLWMSPEQIDCSGTKSNRADTRSDIFSLGAVLYQLLTGTTPILQSTYQSLSYSELVSKIREEIPPKPTVRLDQLEQSKDVESSKSKAHYKNPMRRKRYCDLDWIVMKSLEKEPERRYDGVASLANDVKNFLEFGPVQARRPSAAYHLKIFFRKHRLATSFGLAIAILLVVASVVSTSLAIWAFRERATALNLKREVIEAAANDREILDLIGIGLSTPFQDTSFARSDAAAFDVAAVIDRLERNEFSNDPLKEIEFRLSVGRLTHRLGNYKIAKSQFLRALEISLKADKKNETRTISLLKFLGKTAYAEGNYSEAVRLFEKILELRSKHSLEDWDLKIRSRLANSYHKDGQTDKAIHLAETTRQLAHENFDNKREVFLRIMGPLATFYSSQKNYKKANEICDQLYDYLNKTRLVDVPLLELECCKCLMTVYEETGQYSKAIRLAERAINTAKSHFPTIHNIARSLAVSHARLLKKNGETEKAIDLLRTLAPSSNQLSDSELLCHHEVEFLLEQMLDEQTFNSYTNTKSILDVDEHMVDEAIELIENQIVVSERKLANRKKQLGKLYLRKSCYTKSITPLKQSLSFFEKHYGETAEETLDTMRTLFVAYQSNQSFQEAIKFGKRILHSQQASNCAADEEIHFIGELSRSYSLAGDQPEAIRLAKKVLNHYRSHLKVEHKPTQIAFHRLRGLLIQNNQTDDALRLHQSYCEQFALELGEGHPHAIFQRKNYAVALQLAGRVEDATIEFDKVMKLCDDNLPFSMSNFNSIIYIGYYQNHLMAHSQFESAKKVIDRWLKLISVKSFQYYNRTIWAKASLADYYASVKMYDQSKEVVNEIFELMSSIPSFPKYTKPANRELLRAKSILGLCLAHEGNYRKAESLCIEAFQGLKKNSTCTNRVYHRWYLTKSIDRLIEVYQLAGREAEAEHWKNQRDIVESELQKTLHEIQIY